MWFLYLLSYVSLLIHLSIAVVSIACFLYCVSEVVEEYTAEAKRIIHWSVYFAAGADLGATLFDGVPVSLTVVNMCGLAATLSMLKTFPCCQLTSPSLIITCVCSVISHYLAINFFLSVSLSFSECASYMTICLWLVPFELVVSLSTNENTLPIFSDRRRNPSHDDDLVSNYFSRNRRGKGLRHLFALAKESVFPAHKKGFWSCCLLLPKLMFCLSFLYFPWSHSNCTAETCVYFSLGRALRSRCPDMAVLKCVCSAMKCDWMVFG